MKRLLLILGLWAALLAGFWFAPALPLEGRPQNLFFGQNGNFTLSAIQLVNIGSFTPGVNGGTTGAVNCTGANFIALGVSVTHAGTPAVSSSPANTFSLVFSQNGTYQESRLYYIASANVSSAMTFTVTGTSYYPAVSVACFSGLSATPYDTHDSASAITSGTALTPGSLTPVAANSLVVTSVSMAPTVLPSSPLSITPGWIITSNIIETSSVVSYAGGLAYKIQTADVPANPTWTAAIGAGSAAAVMGSFK